MTHSVSLRVWGEFACFTRPEMKVERVSYRVPTPSAARGILEAVFWEPEMHYLIDRITVVKPGKWFSFRRNEVGKVISIDAAKRALAGKEVMEPIHSGGGAEDAAQRNMLALTGVEYVIDAEIRLTAKGESSGEKSVKYVEMFRKRAQHGKCAHRPALGVREFAADFDYCESKPFIDKPLNEELGLMLFDVFDPVPRKVEKNVNPQPVFFNAVVSNGVLDCHPDRITLLRPGKGKV